MREELQAQEGYGAMIMDFEFLKRLDSETRGKVLDFLTKWGLYPSGFNLIRLEARLASHGIFMKASDIAVIMVTTGERYNGGVIVWVFIYPATRCDIFIVVKWDEADDSEEVELKVVRHG